MAPRHGGVTLPTDLDPPDGNEKGPLMTMTEPTTNTPEGTGRERILATYRASRRQGAPAWGALNYARMENRLAIAESQGRIRFKWEDDDDYRPEDSWGLDEPEQTQVVNEERRKLESGEWVVLGCIAETPPVDLFGIFQPDDDIAPWKHAASVWGVVLDAADAWRHLHGYNEPDYEMRMVEVEMASEAGVL